MKAFGIREGNHLGRDRKPESGEAREELYFEEKLFLGGSPRKKRVRGPEFNDRARKRRPSIFSLKKRRKGVLRGGRELEKKIPGPPLQESTGRIVQRKESR